MKKLFLIIALFLFVTTNSLEIEASEESAETRVIAGFDKSIDLSVLEGIPYQLHHTHDSIDAVSISLPSDYVDGLSKIDEIDWVENDQVVKTNFQSLSWANDVISSNFYQDNSITGKGVEIGVIDTGIRMDHPDLNVVDGVSFVEGMSSYEDNNGHGTHVAGIIGALNNDEGVVGVAPDTDLYAIKSLDINGEGRQADIIEGVEWAIAQDLDIINLSVTTPIPSIALKKAVEAADEAGILVVAASGNAEDGEGQITDDVLFPSRFSSVISVGAIDKRLEKTYFSYQGASLDFVAPGEDIYSTYFEAPDYITMSGTSMAAPYVTGILALYKEVYPDMDNQSLIKIVQNKAKDIGAKGRDDVYGYGLIQGPDSWFWDVDPSSWFADYVYLLRQSEYIGGYPDGSYQAENQITRGEVATVIGSILEMDGTNRLTDFTDVNLDYFASGYIDSLTAANIVSGYPNKTFMPEKAITRGEAAVLIQTAFSLNADSENQFGDVNADRFYADAVNDLAVLDIISGYPNGQFKPENQISRAEFSVMVGKILDEAFQS
ncbi:S8 family serine peptidase [Gracilibacillus oryzae]|uniref:S8 family serine peptidase n=1 Tax=Gracilibacillus oryzae TaxID=1672701 RepID=A0A7C8KTI2_9BACI|nr:S8 family serine peptidase [Gracilibacillus oryzae]KAB8138053.1 S8 family serine peptidase [Gracilibacillus oryzae]